MHQALHKVKHHARRAGSHLWDHFVPHGGNDHHPHVLKHRVLFGYSIFLVLLKAVALVAPIALPSSSLYSSAITPVNIVALTNQTRENLDLTKLSANEKLAQAAQAKAEDMLIKQYFAHTSPEGLTPWYWFKQAGYKYAYAGENLAVNFTTAEGVQEGWLASPSHRANIVNAKYQEIGVGVATGKFEGYESTFVVQMFGSPSGGLALSEPVTVPKVQPEIKPAPIPQPAPSQVAAAEVKPAPVSAPAPEPEKAPEPAPTPVVQEPPAAPTSEAGLLPILDESSVKVAQQPGYYDVTLAVTNATAVSAQLQNNWVQLQSIVGTSTWQGKVPYDLTTLSTSGEPLSIAAWSAGGRSISQVIAMAAPAARTQQLYTFSEGSSRFVELFGFLKVGNLADKVTQFYFAFMVFLAAALLINILVKIKIQKLSVISHATLVLALTLLLTII